MTIKQRDLERLLPAIGERFKKRLVAKLAENQAPIELTELAEETPYPFDPCPWTFRMKVELFFRYTWLCIKWTVIGLVILQGIAWTCSTGQWIGW